MGEPQPDQPDTEQQPAGDEPGEEQVVDAAEPTLEQDAFAAAVEPDVPAEEPTGDGPETP